MIEGVGSVVSERIDCLCIVLVAEAAWDELEIILQTEVFGLFADHLLEAADAANGHLDANHHVENEIPIVVAEEDHLSLTVLYSFVHVACSLHPMLFELLLSSVKLLL